MPDGLVIGGADRPGSPGSAGPPDPLGSPGPPGRRTSSVATALARTVLGGMFRAVEVQGRSQLPVAGPVVVIANHANGMVDPLLVVHALGYLPRFVAKAGLWRHRPLRPVLGRLGMLPVVRRQDRVRAGETNAETFAAAHRALAQGATVGIFPEGTAHDAPHLLPLRTGAARLALGARAEGAVGLQIVPVGLVFDDKLALRSRALAVVGAAIDLDGWAVARGEPTVDDTDRAAVEDLTARLVRALNDVLPSADTVEEAWALAAAADVVATRTVGADDTLRVGGAIDVDGRPALSAAAALRRRLGEAPAAARHAVREAVDGYRRALALAGLRDHDLVSAERSGHLVRRAVLLSIRSVALAPWAVLGAAVNALPYGLVRVSGRLAAKPAGQGTVRVLVGALAFPLAWIGTGVAVGRRRSPWFGVAVAAGGAIGGYATVVELEQVAALRRAWRGRTRRLGLHGRLDDLLAARSRLIDAAEAALAAPATKSLAGDRGR